MSDHKEGHCDLCGEPMPAGEEMFRYHGYSGPCPKPIVLNSAEGDWVSDGRMRELWTEAGGFFNEQGLAYIPHPAVFAQTLRNLVNSVVKIAKEHR